MMVKEHLHKLMMSYCQLDNNGNVIFSNENYNQLLENLVKYFKIYNDRENKLIDIINELKQTSNDQRSIQKADQIIEIFKKDYYYK